MHSLKVSSLPGYATVCPSRRLFQTAFYAAGSLRLCLAMLGQNNFLHQADPDTRQSANHSLLRLLKFNMYISGRLLVNRVTMGQDSNTDCSAVTRAQAQVCGLVMAVVKNA